MLKTLLRVRMAALLAAFTGQSRKRKSQTKGKAAGYAFLMLYCFCAFVFLFYTSFSQFAAAFFPAGLGWLYFAMFAIMAFALMFIGSVFTAKSQLFEAKDNELLLSMPVPPGMILLSRMAALLAMNFVLELVVALPVFVSWLQYGETSGTGIAAFVVIVLALPLFSLAVSCLFAWLVSLVTSHMRNTTAVTMVISVVFMLAYFLFCFRMNSYVTQLAANGAAIAGALGSAAPLVWLGRAAADGSLADLGLTLLWTVLPFVLAYVLLNRSFIRIVTTRRGQVKVRYEKKAMRASSQDAALYRRELARLTSSSGYMLNAGLGLVFELVLAVLAVVKRRELLGALTAIPELYAAAAPILLLACMMVSGMVFFTASSVSLEGKSYWIVRSMPVETKKVLQAKLSLSNSLAIAPALLMTLAAALALRLPAAETALLLACQLLFVLLTANVGLMEDLRHCNLDWINETQAAKQGAGVLLSMLLGFGFVVAVGALYFFLLAELMPTTAFLGLILALMAILYALTARWLMTRGVKRFETLHGRGRHGRGRLYRAVRERFPVREAVGAQKRLRAQALLQIVEQQKRAGAAVAAGVVVVEVEPQMVAERVQLVVRQVRICLSAHLAGAQIRGLRLPVDAIIVQTAGQHPQIKRRVVRDQNAVGQHRLQQLPERGKVRLAAHLLRRDAGQRDIERIKVRLRVDKRVKLLHDLAALDHADADGAHAPVLRVRRFHVERHITFFHSSTPFDRMEPV